MVKSGVQVSNRVVMIMVIVAIAVSLVSTYMVSLYVKNIQPLTIKQSNVVTKIVGPPVQSSGYVTVEVIPKKEKVNSTNG